MSYMISQTYQLDAEVLHKISNLLMQHQINNEYFPDGWKMLESLIKIRNYQKINLNAVDDINKAELAMTINNLIEERKEILNVFDLFLNKMLFLNYDFLKTALGRERERAEALLREIDKNKKELLESSKHVEKLNLKLMKSRDQLKQFLETGRVEDMLDAETYNRRNNKNLILRDNILNTSHDMSGECLIDDNSAIFRDGQSDVLDNGFATKRFSTSKNMQSPLNKNVVQGLSSIHSAADLHNPKGKGMLLTNKNVGAPLTSKAKASPIHSKLQNGSGKTTSTNAPLNSSFRSNYESGGKNSAMVSSRGDLNKSGLIKAKPEDLKPTVGMKKSENGKKPSTMSISSISQITNTKTKK